MLSVIDIPDKITVSLALLISAAGTVATTVYYISKLLGKIEDRLQLIENKISEIEHNGATHSDVEMWTLKLKITNPTLEVPDFIKRDRHPRPVEEK